jgi:hypothetical protein
MDLFLHGFGVAISVFYPMYAVKAINKEDEDKLINAMSERCPDG